MKDKIEKLFKDSYVNYYKTQTEMSEEELIEEFEIQKAADEKRFEDMIELLTMFGDSYLEELSNDETEKHKNIISHTNGESD